MMFYSEDLETTFSGVAIKLIQAFLRVIAIHLYSVLRQMEWILFWTFVILMVIEFGFQMPSVRSL